MDASALSRMSDDEEEVLVGKEEAQPKSTNARRTLAVGMLIFAAGAAVAIVAMKTIPMGAPLEANVSETAEEWEANDRVLSSGDCNTEWESTSSLVPMAKAAAENAFNLIMVERKQCTVPVGPLPFNPEDFLKGEGHKHYMHVHIKAASDCKSKTYKLEMFVGMEEKPIVVVQVNQNINTRAWRLLHSNPHACHVKAGSASAPQVMSLHSDASRRAAKFAVHELSYQMTKAGCDQGKLEVGNIRGVVASVVAGVSLNLFLDVEAGGVTKAVKLTVVERCAKDTPCVRQLSVPDGDVCKVLDAGSRRLADDVALGAEPDDPTELMVAQQQALYSSQSRRLGGSNDRAPLQQRHITSGAVAASHDPRGLSCFHKIAVYNQGTCGSCYANAIGQMMGIRKCMSDNGEHRRLALTDLSVNSSAQVDEVESQEEGRRLAARTTKAGCACKSKCSNPDGSAGDWCFVQSKSCQGTNWGYCKPKNTPQPACADSTTFNSPRSCPWFHTNDPGCTKYRDYGQRTHCKKTCNTCPTVNNQNTDANPWKSASYQYMPSVSDLAQCAKSSNGQMQGCKGGNTQGVWNNWMRKLNRKVWVMGEQCKPYNMKCISSSGVVNPLNPSGCSKYSAYQVWHKPCSCISRAERPQSLQCPASRPSSSCGFDIPYAFFTVSGIEQGLSNRDSVLNMQRHIAEYGPIYVSFQTTNAFMHWKWAQNPVYTGGSTVDGGHAVLAVGWGALGNTDYWILRNSWGADWADHGYAKFKRGVNLDGIEGSTAASMPVNDFKDWSPPYCELSKWSWGWGTRGGRLSSYSLTLKVTCSKPATVKIFTSVPLSSRSEIQRGVSGQNLNQHISRANVDTPTSKIDIKALGFGRRSADMWVHISAHDAAGNKAETSHFVNLPAKP